jgi:ribose transport system substrate-binding protein
MKLSRSIAVAAAAVALAAASSCSFPAARSTTLDPGASQKADQALAKLKTEPGSPGPNGEAPAPASAVELTPEEIAKVKALNAKAGIALHFGGNDWSNAQVAGLKSEFERLGIQVVAVTDANFSPDKQTSDIETMLAKKPNIIVSIPTDTTATAPAYKKAAAAGVKIVFMDLAAKGMVPGKDYVAIVSADNYRLGVVTAHLMAKAISGKGEIGMIYHGIDFPVNNERRAGAESTFKQYPDIKIVEKKGIVGPDFAGDAQNVASAMLSKHANLKGIWAIWDVPAEGVMAAARANGRLDLAITAQDLGKIVALGLARNELMVGVGAQVPFDQGVTEARVAAGALIGKQEPTFVSLGALPVTHENVLQAWTQVYHQPPPPELKDAYLP